MRILLLLLASIPLFGYTIVQQNVVNPNGTPASGYVYLKATSTCVSGPNFLGNGVITVHFTNGSFSVSLIPNDTCVPAGSAYAVTWQISGAQAQTEYWVVPTSSTPVNLAAVRAVLPPSPTLLFSPAQLSQSNATMGQCMIWSGTAWGPQACAAASSVLSLFGRTGVVVATTGDYNTSQVTENGNLYYTTARARSAFSATSPLAYNGSTGVFSCPTCGTGAITTVFGRAGVVVAAPGDYNSSQVTENTNLYFTQARARAAFSGTSPIVFNSSTGAFSCPTCGTGTGNMDSATYDPANLASQVEVIAHKNLANGFAGLDGSIKLSIAQVPTGITGSTVPFGNDARFSDSRTPLAHAASHKNGGSDEIATATPTANAIPKAGAGGTLDSGWFPTAAISTVFGRTGAVVATSGDYTTAQVSESGNLYFTTARAIAAMAGLYQSPISGAPGTWPTTFLPSAPGVSTLGGVKSGQCTTVTDKLMGYDTSGNRICESDQTGAGGSGITSLNTLTGTVQTLAKVDDTNVTLGIGSAGTAHTFTLGWTGTLAKARQHTLTLYSDGSYTDPTAFTFTRTGGRLTGFGAAAGLNVGIIGGTVAAGNDSRFTDARTPLAHAASHKNGGSDEVATATPAANAIPKAGIDGKLDSGWFPAGTVTSIFGRTGVVTATTGDYTTAQVTESGNLYFTNARAIAALSGLYQTPISSAPGTWPTSFFTLNTLTAAAQTFASANDTNVTLTIGSATSTHTFTLGWTGALAKVRQHANTLYSDGTYSDPTAFTFTRTGGRLTGFGAAAGLNIGTTTGTAAAGDDSRFTNARTPVAHAASHKNGGSDEVATATPAANAIPKAGAGGTLATGWIPATDVALANLPAAAKVRTCELAIGGPGSASPILANDDDLPHVCANETGATLTITAVHCYAPVGSPTVTPMLVTGGTSTSILASTLTCSSADAAGSLSGTPTLASGSWIDGNITVAGGVATYLVIRITMTL